MLIGDVPADLSPVADPDEVADLRWTSVDALLRSLADDPRSYAPWLAGVTQVLASSLSAEGSGGG